MQWRMRKREEHDKWRFTFRSNLVAKFSGMLLGYMQWRLETVGEAPPSVLSSTELEVLIQCPMKLPW